MGSGIQHGNNELQENSRGLPKQMISQFGRTKIRDANNKHMTLNSTIIMMTMQSFIGYKILRRQGNRGSMQTK